MLYYQKNMLKLLTLALSLASCTALFSQQMRLGLYGVKGATSELSAMQREAIHTKLRGWMTGKDLVVADVHAPVGVQPELIFGAARTVDAGMKKLTVVDAELVLTLQQVNGNPAFASYTKQLSASGNDANAAKRELISKMPTSDAGFEAFLRENTPKVVAYYAENCKAIQSEAEALGARQEFDKALGLLVNMPNNLPCAEASKGMVSAFYEKRRDAICGLTLLRAKAAAAKKDYDAAVKALHHIDPIASCFGDAMKFVDELKASADADFGAQLDTLKAYYGAKANVDDQQRILIVQDHLMMKHF
jgi:hypothetical protein